MLKNKYWWLGPGLAFAITNTVTLISNSNNPTIINVKQNNEMASNRTRTVTNSSYGSLSNSSTLSIEDEKGVYHLFDIKEILDNPKLAPYAKEIYINNYKLTYDVKAVDKDIIDEFNKNIAAVNYHEQQLTSTNDFQILQKQNLSKCSTTVYKSNKESSQQFVFLQFGGANSHVVLTGTKGIVDHIANYNDLSETLGLYYIGQSHAKNSRAICMDFVKQFINKSSLKNKQNINDNIYENIVSNMIDSSNLVTTINQFAISNTSKDMSIRYLLDSTGNVLSVGYCQYDSTDVDTNHNLMVTHQFPKDEAKVLTYDTEITCLLKWNDYADSWSNFMFLYPTIFASATDNISYNVMNETTTINSRELNFTTKKIKTTINQLPVWRVVNQPPAGHKSQGLVIYLLMWHDENNIYQQVKSSSISRAFENGPSFSINISKWTISNIINKKY